jgi:small subunit ribosomal protein S20
LPTTKTAEKELRVATRRLGRNKSVRSATKTSVTSAESAIAAGNIDEAKKAVAAAVSALDKEAEKGTVHGNNAARRKARLMKKLNRMTPVAKPVAEEKPVTAEEPATEKKATARKSKTTKKE